MMFAGDLAAVFQGPDSFDATYHPQQAPSKTVRMLRSSPDRESLFNDTTITSETDVFQVQVSEIEVAQAGDRIQLEGGKSFLVKGKPSRGGTMRLVWILDTVPTDAP